MLYVMFLEHRMRAFQGAFHMNPDYVTWYGLAEMKKDLVKIKNEAASMINGHKQEVITGSLKREKGGYAGPLFVAK